MATKVFHTTMIGRGDKIAREGWRVTYDGVNVYGRGIYFWELLADAHTYGEWVYDDEYEIVEEWIPITRSNSEVYSHRKARGSHIDAIAQGLLARGIQVLIITNHMINSSMNIRAKGRAYLWLVDIRRDETDVLF